MTEEQKKQVRQALIRYLERYGQPVAMVSAETVAQATGAQWMNVTEHEWLLLAQQVGFYEGHPATADTSTNLFIRLICNDARNQPANYWLSSAESNGKTFAALQYARTNNDVYYLPCKAQMNIRTFMQALLQACMLPPCDDPALILLAFISGMEDKSDPLIIVDDAHLLKERVFNKLQQVMLRSGDGCGFVVLGAKALYERAHMAGALPQQNLILNPASADDIALICAANGVDGKEAQIRIVNDCSGSLRTIRELIEEQTAPAIAA